MSLWFARQERMAYRTAIRSVIHRRYRGVEQLIFGTHEAFGDRFQSAEGCGVESSSGEVSIWGNKYVLVMIEHFIKWVELVPLPNKSADLTAATFLESVLSRFGAPAEVVTDQGSELRGSFLTCCIIMALIIDWLLGSIRKLMACRNAWFRQ